MLIRSSTRSQGQLDYPFKLDNTYLKWKSAYMLVDGFYKILLSSVEENSGKNLAIDDFSQMLFLIEQIKYESLKKSLYECALWDGSLKNLQKTVAHIDYYPA